MLFCCSGIVGRAVVSWGEKRIPCQMFLAVCNWPGRGNSVVVGVLELYTNDKMSIVSVNNDFYDVENNYVFSYFPGENTNGVCLTRTAKNNFKIAITTYSVSSNIPN